MKECVYVKCFAVWIALLFCSCQKSDSLSQGRSVQFSTKIAATSTSVDGERLDDRYSVGIFFTAPGSALEPASVINSISNQRFVTDGSGLFQSENLSVNYPDAQAVDILAYAPYRRNLTDFRFPLDLNDQSRQQELDFMYSNNILGLSDYTQHPLLISERQLVRIQIRTSSTLGRSLTGMRVALTGMRTEGFYDFRQRTLHTASNSIRDIQAHVTPLSNTNSMVEFTLFPTAVSNAQKVVFTLSDGVTYTWELSPEDTYERGHRYVYDMVLGDGEATPTGPPRIYFETPVLTNDPQRTLYITHMMPEDNTVRNYSILYDTQYKMAYWVAYPMHASYLGSSGRSNAWGFDPQINFGLQPTLNAGFGIPNTDRGHQIASADRTSSVAANASTFYFSNMTPQHSRLNQGLWANLENRVRTWINRTDTLYVVTGAMPTSSTDQQVRYVTDNQGVQVARPKYYYKAIAARNGSSYETIAFRMDNVQPANNDFNQHRITVEELERETGFAFFPSIPNSAKRQVNMAFWQ